MSGVAFRTDASTTIGIGHVMRCLTLADALKSYGVESVFIHRDLPGNLAPIIRERGFEVRLLAVGEDDAAATIAEKPSWVVVDHYAIDRRWESSVRNATDRVMVIDDLADREHDCDVLLDQNLVSGMERRYDGKVPTGATRLLGPTYALLDPIYAAHRSHARERSGAVRRILAFFGGGDNTELTLRAVDAFIALDRNDITLDLVVAGAGVEMIQGRVANHGNIELHGRVSTLVPLIERADLFVGAGGSTTWERLCLGLPSLVVTIAENQRPIAAELDRLGLVRWLGSAAEVSSDDIRAALTHIVESGLDPEWSRRCLEVVDGKGVERVCHSMLAQADDVLQVRPVRADDKWRLLEWANDRTTRANAFSTAPISADAHERWFKARIGNPSSARIYIVETTRGIPVAQVRFDRDDDRWLIDYAVAPHLRGRGFGRSALNLSLTEFFRAEPSAKVVGEVKSTNVASCRVFESLGFARSATGDRLTYTMTAGS